VPRDSIRASDCNQAIANKIGTARKEIRDQKSEVRSQKSEVRSQESGFVLFKQFATKAPRHKDAQSSS